jgi:hypothetical protein
MEYEFYYEYTLTNGSVWESNSLYESLSDALDFGIHYSGFRKYPLEEITVGKREKK